LGPIPNPQSPIPNPQSPFFIFLIIIFSFIYKYVNKNNYLNFKKKND